MTIILFAIISFLIGYCVWYMVQPQKPKKQKAGIKSKKKNKAAVQNIAPPNIEQQMSWHAQEFNRLNSLVQQQPQAKKWFFNK